LTPARKDCGFWIADCGIQIPDVPGSVSIRNRKSEIRIQEKDVLMKFLLIAFAIAFLFVASGSARAQEPELISEIVARVNNDIITRADYLNAIRDFKEELSRQMHEAGKKDAEVDAEFERLKGTVLDYLIDDLLLE